jgi:membrane-associated phospholipid phosphatase
MIGIGGLTGMLFGLSQILNAGLEVIITGLILVSGLLGTARMQLGAHTPAQIYTGFVIGFLTEWLILRWFAS